MTQDTLPEYKKIKNYIVEQIHTGVWLMDQLIPSEHELAQLFNVSRMTVNRAVTELTAEGVLTRRRGAGTYVAQKKFSNVFVTLRNIRADIEATGRFYSAILVRKGRIEHKKLPEEAIHVFFECQNLFCIEMLHMADGTPVQYERRFVDLNLIPSFEVQDFLTISPSQYLIKNSPLENGHYKINAYRCPRDIALQLKMNESDPALVLTRYTYSNEMPLTYVEMWHNGDKFCFDGDLN